MTETIPALFARQAETLSRRTLFLVKRDGAYQPVTWQQAAADAQALGTFLLAQQVNFGDRVLIFSENRPEWAIADIAIQSIGAWTVPVYPNLSEQDLKIICRDAEPTACIVSTSEQVRKVLEVSRTVPSIRSIVVIEPDQQHQALVVRWADALANGLEWGPRLRDLAEHRRRQILPEHPCTLIYTSGTTGDPKGVMLSHANFLSNVEACLRIIPLSGADLHLSFLPLSHVFERMAGWYLPLVVGSTIAFAENMDTIPQNMAEVRPTVMLGVPRFFEKLYARVQEGVQRSSWLKRWLAGWAIAIGGAVASRRQAGRRVPPVLAARRWLADALVFRKLRAHFGGRLRFFVSGSAPLAQSIAEFFFDVGIIILEGYGLTETSPVIAVNRPPLPRFGSVGRPLPGVEVRLAEDGEIMTRGPHVMCGYYRKPEATAEALKDGWLCTGDIGRFDEDGFLYITDRKKDLIKTAGGKFIAPQKLESLFVADPYISQAFVYGDKHPYCVALIVPRTDALRRYAQEQDIAGRSVEELVRNPQVQSWYWNRVQERQQGLAGFEQVKKIALLDQEFSQAAGELTPTLKTKRAAIALRYASVLEALYQASPS